MISYINLLLSEFYIIVNVKKVKDSTMSYWGFVNTYGLYTSDSDGDRIGSLVRFYDKSSRDQWIDEEVHWSNIKREAISSKEVRRILEKDYRCTADPEDVRLGIYSMSEYAKLLSIDQLWDHYVDLRSRLE